MVDCGFCDGRSLARGGGRCARRLKREDASIDISK